MYPRNIPFGRNKNSARETKYKKILQITSSKKKHDLALTLTNYKSPQANDIAIITLKKALKWTDNVGPICLPPSVNFEDRVAVVTGWGTLEYRE